MLHSLRSVAQLQGEIIKVMRQSQYLHPALQALQVVLQIKDVAGI